jgi:hypothetical protein
VDEYFTKFIYSVYTDLGQPENYSISRLAAWFLDDANIGKLNNLIGTIFTNQKVGSDCGTFGYLLDPVPSNDQLAIYKMLFDYEYYKNEARANAKSSASVGGDWINLREGDSSISRVNKNEISKTFRALAQDAKEDLDKAVKFYLKYNAVPDKVAGDDTQGISNYIIQEYARVSY